MSQEIVIFDTNAYRNFIHGFDEIGVRDRARKLVTRENKCGITVGVSAPVLIELFAHLADPADPAYDICRRALVAAWEHASGHSENALINVIPEGMLLLSKSLFPDAANSQEFRSREENNGALTSVLKGVGEVAVSDDLSAYQQAFDRLAQYVKSEEARFIQHMRNLVSQLDPSTSDWRIYKNDKVKRRGFLKELRSPKGLEWIARSYVVYGYELVYGKPPIQEDLSGHVKELIRLFQTPLEVYREILVLFAGNGFNMDDPDERRENFRWDIDILFGLSSETLASKHLTLVTGDGKMLNAALQAGLGTRAQRLPDYLQRVGL
ncbi:MAG: hypothetical protein JST22_12800 [Bacteroidetes bacterium]|nr:hypothetical protein [Bacteroidota bacterium]